jgi:hypothetical protein
MESRHRVIYFAKASKSELIKIGKTTGNPSARLATLACGSTEEFQLLGVIQDAPETLEKELHRRFSAHRQKGEWFRPDPELLRFIDENAKPWESPLKPEGSRLSELELPRRLRRMLDERGCSISEAARFAGMERQQVWRIVTGVNTNPGIATLETVVSAVGGTLGELFRDFA